jgi:hypothetical protein
MYVHEGAARSTKRAALSIPILPVYGRMPAGAHTIRASKEMTQNSRYPSS